jgi:amidase
LGLEVVEVVVPPLEPQLMMDTWSTLCAADAADAHRATWPSRADAYGPFRQWLEFADTQTAADYAAAHNTRLEYAGKIANLFEEIDLLACPAMPYPAPQIGPDGLPVAAPNVVRPRFTYPFNFSNSPTLTLPCGFTADNLPIALQLVGPHFSEATLLRAGHAYEQATRWHTHVPPV